jgi:fatty-acid desaturase
VTPDFNDISNAHKNNWTNIIAFGFFHLGAIAALFMFSWRPLAVALFLYWMCTGLGISMATTDCTRTGPTRYLWRLSISLRFAAR